MATYQPGPGGPGSFVSYQKPAAKKKAAPGTWMTPSPAVAGAIAGQNVSTPGSYNPPAAPAASTPVYTPPPPPAITPAAAPAAPTYNYQNAPISDILGSDPFYQQ